MPIRFIFFLIVAALVLIGIIVNRAFKRQVNQLRDTPEGDKRTDNYGRTKLSDAEDGAAISKVVTAVLFGIAALLFLSSSLTVVGTRRIGVVTEFGRPTDSLSNGIHIKPPWANVPELDGSIQTDSYVGNNDDGTKCTEIRLGNESRACVDNTVRWRIINDEADNLYRDFRSMDKLRESLVTRELNASLNEVLGTFNPLDAVNLDDTGALASLNDLATAVTESLRERVQGRVEILSVTIPLIRYDDRTQDRLDEYQQEVARTRVAQQAEQTASARAAANRALADSVSNDPNVLVAQCFAVLQQMVEENQPVPAGFSCWPGGSSAIVLPQASAGQ